MCSHTIDNLLKRIETTREKLNSMVDIEGVALHGNDILDLSRKLDFLIVQYENHKTKKLV